MTTVETLIVGSSPAPDAGGHYPALITAARTLIAADGGLALCLAAGRVPDICVGDFDSVDPSMLEHAIALGAEVRRFPRSKDESDLDLAVDVAREVGDRLTISAAYSQRVDHTLASLGTLLRAVDLEARADEPRWTAYPLDAGVRPTLALDELPGTVLSLMAPAGESVVSVSGVAYPLETARLQPLSSLGLSNVACASSQRIDVHSGMLLVVVNRPLTLSRTGASADNL